MEGSNVIKKMENRNKTIDEERKKAQKLTTLILSSLSDIQGKMAPRMSA